MSTPPSQPMKRTSMMAELASLAKETFKAHRFAKCTQYANQWRDLATVNDMVRAPKYLRWSGRIS